MDRIPDSDCNHNTKSELHRENELLKARIAELEASNQQILAQDEQLHLQAQIIDNSPIIAAYHDKDLNMVWANKAYQKATGLSLEEIRGRKCYQVWNLSQPCRGCPVIRAMETGTSASHELTPDNQDHWPKNQGCWLSQASPVRDSQGAIIGAIEFATETTERRQSERVLQESEAKFRSVVDSIPVAIYLSTGVDQVSEYVNQTMVKLFGYTQKEIPSVAEWWPLAYPDPDYRKQLSEEWNQKVARAIATQTTTEPMETVVTCKDGSQKIILWDFITLGDRNYAFGLNLTELKHSEEELRAANQQLRATEQQLRASNQQLKASNQQLRSKEAELRESEAGVRNKLRSLVDPDCDISNFELSDIIDNEILQSMLQGFCRITGMAAAVVDLSGKILAGFGWQDICTRFHRCNPDTLKNCIDSDTILTQGVLPGTIKCYKCKNNLWDMVTPLMAGERHVGNVFFGQFFFEGEEPDLELFRTQARQYGFDETEYMKAFARVQYFKRETAEEGLRFLAQLTSIITMLSYSAIKQARMLATQKRLGEELKTLNSELDLKVIQRTAMLEASNKDLDAFCYSVSHDLRAPLRHINGYVELLNNRFRESLPEKACHYLSEINDSAQQMGDLIDDLLQFSRNGRQELRKCEVDMNVAVQEAIEKLKTDTEGRIISWTVADLPRVPGDYSLLQQVWINLLENAVKYSQPRDEAKIEVGCTRKADTWEFFVRDNGVGFDMQFVHKLFGVFQRLHSHSKFEGTGIGLANVQRIINKHGGHVRAEGKPDVGAIFYFTIPLSCFDEGGKS